MKFNNYVLMGLFFTIVLALLVTPAIVRSQDMNAANQLMLQAAGAYDSPTPAKSKPKPAPTPHIFYSVVNGKQVPYVLVNGKLTPLHNVPRPKYEYKYLSYADTQVLRMVDREMGVLCYARLHRDAFDCVPLPPGK